MPTQDPPVADLEPSGPSEPEYRRIAELIADPDSPVGIDAEKTHVLILHKLAVIERRLGELERRIPQEGEETLSP